MEAIVFVHRIYIRRGRIWWAVYDSESILSYRCNARTCARESAMNTGVTYLKISRMTLAYYTLTAFLLLSFFRSYKEDVVVAENQ